MVFSTLALAAFAALSPLLAAPAAASFTPRPSGALFFMTNNPSGNEVVVSSLASTGKATFVKTVATGGKGAVGNNGGGADGLFSQDSVLVKYDNLFVVNPGSNTLSAFYLDPFNPTYVKQLGRPISTFGEFPVSVARSSGPHRQVCVLNGGKVNGVACYHMNHLTGLTPLGNSVRSLGLNQTTPATGPPGTVSDIIFTEDGKQLVVSVKGVAPALGFIAVWDVEDDGSLSKQFTRISATAGGLPFGLAVIPGKNALLAADPAVGATTFSLPGSAHNAKTASVAIPVAGQGAVCWVAYSKQSNSYFLVDAATDIVTEVTLNKNLVGNIVKQYNQTAGSATIDSTVGNIAGHDFLYVLAVNAASPQIDVLSVGKAPGQAKPLQVFDVGAALTKNNTKFTKINLQGLAVYAP